MEEIEIILTDEEFEWIDYGNNKFCSLDPITKEEYQTYHILMVSIIKKLRAVYTEGELRNNNRNILKLTKEEIDYIGERLTEEMCSRYRSICYSQERIVAFENKTIPFYNKILKKLGKPAITLEKIKKKSEQINRT